MSKFIFKSNSAILATSPSPAWTTTEQSGYFVPLVQGSEISVSVDRQTSKQIGSQKYAIDDIVRSPDVNFNVSYLFSPYLVNEYLFGLYKKEKLTSPTELNQDQNFYLIINDQNGNDFLPSFTGAVPRSNFSGVTCISIGNCFLNNYSVGFNVGSLPTVSCSFVGSNLKLDNLTGNRMGIPAINLQSGNQVNSGFVDFSNFKTSLSGYSAQVASDVPNVYRLPVTKPSDVQPTLSNLQCGGATLISGALIQSFNIDIPIERTNLYGLGSNYVYGRKANSPARGSVSISVIVDDFNTGELASLNRSEQSYDFEIDMQNPKNGEQASFIIQNAKVNSVSYSLSTNGRMDFSANYSFEINDNEGLIMTPYVVFATNESIWQNVNIAWNAFE
jgi:hypothetical protein